MAITFEYCGGVAKHGEHTTEKFLLFFLVGGEELPLFVLLERDGLMTRLTDTTSYNNGMSSFSYQTNLDIVKVFMSTSGFGVPKRFHSFYLQLHDSDAPKQVVTIRGIMSQNYFFRAKANFLKKSEVLKLLGRDNLSRKFLKKQPIPPVAFLRKIITIDKSEMRKGVRQIRIGRKR